MKNLNEIRTENWAVNWLISQAETTIEKKHEDGSYEQFKRYEGKIPKRMFQEVVKYFHEKNSKNNKHDGTQGIRETGFVTLFHSWNGKVEENLALNFCRKGKQKEIISFGIAYEYFTEGECQYIM